MTNVLILAGGTSSEREVSLRSGASVKTALHAAGHAAEIYDTGERPGPLLDVARSYDVLFPVVHGTGGEDGELQAELDSIGVPYVGSGETTSRLCFDKGRYRELLKSNDFPVAEGEIVDHEGFKKSLLVQKPYVFKPYDGGSSIDTIMAFNPLDITESQIADVFTRHDRMLLESLIRGIEITVAVLDNQALPVIEIIPPENGVFDYENKYNGASQELCPPVNVPDATQEQAARLAEQIHALCGCQHYSRTDMIVSEDGNLIVLETNTLPGMTDQSLFPKAAAAAGLSMSDLCVKLIELATEHRTETV